MVTTGRDTYRAARLVLAAGAWTSRLLPELSLPLSVERVVQVWLDPRGDRESLAPSRCPITIWEYAPERFFYAFPALEGLVKAALHHQGEPADPDHVRREVEEREVAPLRALLERFIPQAAGRLAATAVCLYTNTPDGHFIVDLHPRHPEVVVLSPCSGHGFKFATALGEIAADLALDGATAFDLGMFRIGRWG